MTNSIKERKYKCPYCPQSFIAPANVVQHIKYKHPESVTSSRIDPSAEDAKDGQTLNPSTEETIPKEPSGDEDKDEPKDETVDELLKKTGKLEEDKQKLQKERDDYKTKLERRENMTEEEVSRRVERLEAEKKEAEKQERLRKRQEQDAKIDQLVKGQEEQGQKLTLIGNMVCDEKGNCRLPTKEDMTTFPTKEELQGSLGALKQDVILALKPEETKEEKKEEEEAKPETEVSEKDKQILEDFPKVRDHVNALTGEQKDSPFGVLAAAAKHAQQTILDSNKGKPQELVEYIPDALKEVIRESGAPETIKKHLESMKPEDIAKYIREQCTGEHCKPITLALRGMGINVQKKTEGGGMLGGGFQDID